MTVPAGIGDRAKAAFRPMGWVPSRMFWDWGKDSAIDGDAHWTHESRFVRLITEKEECRSTRMFIRRNLVVVVERKTLSAHNHADSTIQNPRLGFVHALDYRQVLSEVEQQQCSVHRYIQVHPDT